MVGRFFFQFDIKLIPQMVFLYPATIICIQSKTENLFNEKINFHFHCVLAFVTLL